MDQGTGEDLCTKEYNPQSYLKWLMTKRDLRIESISEKRYDTVVSDLKQEFEGSDYWTQLCKQLKEFDAEYEKEKGYRLLLYDPRDPRSLELDSKEFSNFLNKTWRKNTIHNDNFPNEPDTGWYLPEDWYTQVNDVIRTTIVVKYLDGVQFLEQKCSELSKTCSVTYRSKLEAKDEGYYAAHLYVQKRCRIPSLEMSGTQEIDATMEIQITTQLQENLRKLLHAYYETRRMKPKKADELWQWDYKTREFATNYLGHLLHYVEGMIVEIRDGQKEGGI